MLLWSFLCEQKTGTLLGALGSVGGRKGAGVHGAAQADERVSGIGMDKEQSLTGEPQPVPSQGSREQPGASEP